jgi:hypothetical protein
LRGSHRSPSAIVDGIRRDYRFLNTLDDARASVRSSLYSSIHSAATNPYAD